MDADGGTVVDAPTALDGWLDPGRRWLVTVEGVDDKVALRWRELPSGAVVETEPGAHAMLMVEAGLGFVSTLTITKRVTVTAFELGARTKIMELDHFAPFDAYANLDFDFVLSPDGTKVGWVDAHSHVFDVAARELASYDVGSWFEPLGFTEHGRLCVTPRVFVPPLTESPGAAAYCFADEAVPRRGPRSRRRQAVIATLPVASGHDVLGHFRSIGATTDGPTWCREKDLVAYVEVARTTPPRDRGFREQSFVY